ncbi:hypothetical protein MTR67_040015 [Solanum verrucosum]|uniref:Integrase zinc-binding domain-containing protein n=1 Tax=Solanum verrucosum TaxID=315347 RepID=A0AAF0UHV5_SOLVR|nr:hypothetical protein MTR67_040015 [Solanum verrucosum]
MYSDLPLVYWWNGMKKDIAKFVAKCPICQQVGIDHQKSGGLSRDIMILTWKWEDLNMNFILGLPCTNRQHDSIWVIVDRMKKLAHFIRVKVSYFVKDYAKLYLRDIVRLHGVPLSIIIDRCPYQILRGIGMVAYELDFPNDLASVHPFFTSPS